MADSNDPASETAKAAQEIARTTSNAIDLTREIGQWFDGKFGPPLEAAIGWAITDNLEFGRAASRIRKAERLAILVRQSQARLEQQGVTSIKTLSDRAVAGLIDGASLEDDPALQEMWANLLASALSDDNADELLWTNILKELRPVDATALADYYSPSPDAADRVLFDDHPKLESNGLNGELYGLEVSRNLSRLGLIEPVPRRMQIVRSVIDGGYGRSLESHEAEIMLPGDLYRIQMTSTGSEFCRAVGLKQRPA